MSHAQRVGHRVVVDSDKPLPSQPPSPGRPAGERLPALDDSEIEAAREREFARLSERITLRAKEIRDAREPHPESAPRREALLDEGLFDADSPEAERLKARYRQMVDEYVEEWLSKPLERRMS